MTVQEIYERYRVMPILQLHQLRVAGVAKLIATHFKEPLDAEIVVKACLFHDMGNIIKSDLTLFPEAREPEGIDYWESVKKDFISKYGSDAHRANTLIAEEIGLPKRAIEIIDRIGFSNMQKILESDDLEIKLCEYADTRVSPFGVSSTEERLLESKKRYDARIRKKSYYETDESFELLSQAALGIEMQLFALSTIKPEDINDKNVDPLVEGLRRLVLT